MGTTNETAAGASSGKPEDLPQSDSESWNWRLWFENLLDELDDGKIEDVRAAIVAAIKVEKREAA